MHVPEEDTTALKKWIVKRLEDISDADSDVLADYVLALVKSDDADDVMVISTAQNLEDFLKEHTHEFIQDLVSTISKRSYDLKNLRPVTSLRANASSFNPSAPAFNPPTGPSKKNSGEVGLPAQTRKRRFDDRADSEPREESDPHYMRNDRQNKLRRGPRNGQAIGWQPQQNSLASLFPSLPGLVAPQMPNMPVPPPGLPPFDPSNAIATLLAMQAMGIPLLPNMPGIQLPAPSNKGSVNISGNKKSKKSGQRCRDYDNKGFCTRGNNCPYEHGSEAVTVGGQSEPYDPNNSTILTAPYPANGENRRRQDRSRRGKGRGRKGDNRAAFSMYGDNFDPTNKTIVVEQIPEENLEENRIRDFFSQFGEVEEISVQPQKRLALVQYHDFTSAKAAYQSPKTIFDNRFVKVYWHKPVSYYASSGDPNGFGADWNASNDADVSMEDGGLIDPEEFQLRQEAAQKAYEEKQKRMEETEAKRKEVNERLKVQAEERRKLLEKLTAKAREKATATNGVNGSALTADDKKAATTDALKAKLAELMAEAEAIGLPGGQEQDVQQSNGRGRGGFRGRDGYPPRGRGYGSSFFRGSHRGSFRGGRGSHFSHSRGGAVKRLDNRPKRLLITGVTVGSEKDEQLRSFLFSNFESNTYDVGAGEKSDAQVITFTERYIAEMFISSPPNIEGISLSWMQNATPSTNGNGTAPVPLKVEDAQTADAKEGHDYDIADDDDGAWRGVE